MFTSDTEYLSAMSDVETEDDKESGKISGKVSITGILHSKFMRELTFENFYQRQ